MRMILDLVSLLYLDICILLDAAWAWLRLKGWV